MTRCFIILLLLLCTAPPAARAAPSTAVFDRVVASGKIRCGYFVWPPYIIKDANTGRMSGINYDYMMEIGKILNLKIEWTEEASAATALTGLDTNRYDVMCATLWPDDARLKHAMFTRATMFDTTNAIVRKDDARFDHGAKSFNGSDVTIVGIDGDGTYNMPHADYPKAKMMALPQSADGALMMQSVLTKKADVAFIDKGTMNDFNRTNGNVLKVAEDLPPAHVFSECLAVKGGEVELKILLDHAIQILVDNGKAKELTKRYPGYEYFPPKTSWDNSP